MVSVNLFFYLTIQPAFSHKNYGSTGQLSVKNQPIFQFATDEIDPLPSGQGRGDQFSLLK
jgi:hypothetical protein